jgi:hypothetical protein
MSRVEKPRVGFHDEASIGWISISEVFLLCGVLLLAIALMLEAGLGESRRETIQARTDLEKLKSQVDALPPDVKEQLELVKNARTLSDQLSEARNRLRSLQDLLDDRQRRLADLTRELATLGERSRRADDLARRNRELAAEKGELERRSDELARSVASLNKQLVSLRAEVGRLERILAGKDARIAGLEQDKNRVERDLLAREERIHRPLQTAALVVKVSCLNLPDPLDIDLYVKDPRDTQDPRANLCHWDRPHIRSDNAETGMMILSEDLRTKDDRKEEVFYSNQISTEALPYQVYCMLRDTRMHLGRRGDQPPVPGPYRIDYEIFLRKGNQMVRVDHDTKDVSYIGDILVRKGELIYVGFIPIVGFTLSGQDPDIVLTRRPLGEFPRGFSRDSAAATPFDRIR